MRSISYQNLQAHGALFKRAAANFDRLELQEYRPGTMFKDGAYSWPGDWEGRTLLAWTLLAQSTKREPVYLEEAMSLLPSHLNGQGYFGAIHPPGTVDEQQLSGNSWFLRALCEYYLWKGDKQTLRLIGDMIDHLLLPARGYYTDYPTLPEQRATGGEAIGELLGKAGSWYLSSDVGCAFIMLDGATQAYQIIPKPELAELIDEMAAKLGDIDIIGLSFQTHATLSATRGLIRHYETTGEPRLLQQAIRLFDLYLQRGMTENYANYNWFGRPEWTEPCAVVDSLIIATGLWKHTGKAGYLDTAHHIYYNGLGYGQRPNGGFGCDCCAGAVDGLLSPKEGLFEAYWCCTMRGAEGLSHVIGSSYFAAEGEITIPFFENSEATVAAGSAAITFKQTTAYPLKGAVRLEVIASTLSEPLALRLYLPSWVHVPSLSLKLNGNTCKTIVRDGFVCLSGYFQQGTIIDYSFEIGLRKEKAFGFHTHSRRSPLPVQGAVLHDGGRSHSAMDSWSYRHGPLLLGIDCPDETVEIGRDEAIHPVESDAGTYRLSVSGHLLAPVNDMLDKSPAEAAANRKQVLFQETAVIVE